MPKSGFEDPAEFFGMIFGGEVFKDLIGEISLMKDLTHTMDITMTQMEEETLAQSAEEKLHIHDEKTKQGDPPPAQTDGSATTETAPKDTAAPPPYVSEESSQSGLNIPASDKSGAGSGASTPRRRFGQQAIMDRSEEEARMDAAGLTPEEKELRKKEKKKGGLTKEQREKLEAYERERRKIREERVDTLAKKLIDRISVWTETDKGKDVTKAFEEKTRLEVENLKMESFGLEILHAVGTTYIQKATSFLKSQKFLGISGFFSRLKDKGTLAKETWTTISTAIDAQMTMEEMAKLEEKGGDDWTDEKKAEYEQRVTGKILAAAWRGSKFEIQSVLRDVCDKVLNDKTVHVEKRVERAHALVLCGTIFQKVCNDSCPRSPDILTRLTRPRDRLTRKEITWPSSSSWQMRQRRRRRNRTNPPKRRNLLRQRHRHTSTILVTTKDLANSSELQFPSSYPLLQQGIPLYRNLSNAV